MGRKVRQDADESAGIDIASASRGDSASGSVSSESDATLLLEQQERVAMTAEDRRSRRINRSVKQQLESTVLVPSHGCNPSSATAGGVGGGTDPTRDRVGGSGRGKKQRKVRVKKRVRKRPPSAEREHIPQPADGQVEEETDQSPPTTANADAASLSRSNSPSGSQGDVSDVREGTERSESKTEPKPAQQQQHQQQEQRQRLKRHGKGMKPSTSDSHIIESPPHRDARGSQDQEEGSGDSKLPSALVAKRTGRSGRIKSKHTSMDTGLPVLSNPYSVSKSLSAKSDAGGGGTHSGRSSPHLISSSQQGSNVSLPALGLPAPAVTGTSLPASMPAARGKRQPQVNTSNVGDRGGRASRKSGLKRPESIVVEVHELDGQHPHHQQQEGEEGHQRTREEAPSTHVARTGDLKNHGTKGHKGKGVWVGDGCNDEGSTATTGNNTSGTSRSGTGLRRGSSGLQSNETSGGKASHSNGMPPPSKVTRLSPMTTSSSHEGGRTHSRAAPLSPTSMEREKEDKQLRALIEHAKAQRAEERRREQEARGKKEQQERELKLLRDQERKATLRDQKERLEHLGRQKEELEKKNASKLADIMAQLECMPPVRPLSSLSALPSGDGSPPSPPSLTPERAAIRLQAFLRGVRAVKHCKGLQDEYWETRGLAQLQSLYNHFGEVASLRNRWFSFRKKKKVVVTKEQFLQMLQQLQCHLAEEQIASLQWPPDARAGSCVLEFSEFVGLFEQVCKLLYPKMAYMNPRNTLIRRLDADIQRLLQSTAEADSKAKDS